MCDTFTEGEYGGLQSTFKYTGAYESIYVGNGGAHFALKIFLSDPS